MASSPEFVNYVLEQMQEAGVMRTKKMFGEYGFYCNDVFIGVICDNQCFLKRTAEGEALCKNPQYVSPYEGAKPYLLITDLEDQQALTRVVRATYEALNHVSKKVKKQTTHKGKDIQDHQDMNQIGQSLKALTRLPNIGKVVAEQLIQVGITTPEMLLEVGSKEAWLRILKTDQSACLNRLYALEGAVQGRRWHDLEGEKKAELKIFYEEHKA